MYACNLLKPDGAKQKLFFLLLSGNFDTYVRLGCVRLLAWLLFKVLAGRLIFDTVLVTLSVLKEQLGVPSSWWRAEGRVLVIDVLKQREAWVSKAVSRDVVVFG